MSDPKDLKWSEVETALKAATWKLSELEAVVNRLYDEREEYRRVAERQEDEAATAEERIRSLSVWIRASCDEWTEHGGTCAGCTNDACPLKETP